MTPAASDPEHIAISKSKGIIIDWKDGARSELDNQFLRDHCPCASCTGAHGTPPRPKDSENPLKLFAPKPRIVSVEPAGHYALKITWNDGHSTGIYSYAHLRNLGEAVKTQGMGG